MKKLLVIATLLVLVLTGCSQADRVSSNMAKESDNFNVVRKVTVINAIKNDVIFQMSGRMSIKADKDVTTKDVSKYQYEINYNPKMWVPAKPDYKD